MDEAPTSLDPRRKRLRFRCWHRGTKEADLLLGRFADDHIAGLGPERIEELEALIDVPDPELYAWITGALPVPADYDTPLMRLLKEHSRKTLG